jgi:hypothetical protein
VRYNHVWVLISLAQFRLFLSALIIYIHSTLTITDGMLHILQKKFVIPISRIYYIM